MSGRVIRNISVTTPTEGEYKGTATLALPMKDASYPFTFGIEKARVIVKHIEAVKAFVAKHEKPAADAPMSVEILAAELGIAVEKVQALRNAGKI